MKVCRICGKEFTVDRFHQSQLDCDFCKQLRQKDKDEILAGRMKLSEVKPNKRVYKGRKRLPKLYNME